MKATTYSYRCYSTGVKMVGGSLPKDTTLAQAVGYVTRSLQVKALGADRCVYTHNGKPVYVYLALDPSYSEEGKAAMRAYAKAAEQREREAAAMQERLEDEVENLVRKVGSVAAAIEALKSVGVADE